jgi:hypothetical protein
LFVCVAAVLSGCVANPEREAAIKEFQNTIPTCHNEKQCELMWSVARRWVLDNSAMKLEHVTNDFMETYNPRKYSTNLAARVVKEPLSDGGGYRLVVSLWCNNLFSCVPDASVSALDFNKKVGAVQSVDF